MVSHFSHLEMEKLRHISNAAQRTTGPILQTFSQPSYGQQAPLFPPSPSESLFLSVSAKACCCLLSLPTFLLQSPHSLACSHSCHLSLLLMLHLSLWPGVARRQSCSSPPAAPGRVPQPSPQVKQPMLCPAPARAEHKECSSATKI